MKKYRLKVDSPWGKKGNVISLPDNALITLGINQPFDKKYEEFKWVFAYPKGPAEYPDIFEEVIEQSDSDEERLKLPGIASSLSIPPL